MTDIKLHYKIAAELKSDAHLIGPETILSGIEMSGEGVPEELPSDFEQPHRNSDLQW
jgi:hypothetical protein